MIKCKKCKTQFNGKFCPQCGTKATIKNWIVILLLIVFFPIGFYLMWAKTNWKKVIKIVVTIIISLYFIIWITPTPKSGNNKTNANTYFSETTAPTTEELTTVELTTVEPTTVAPTTVELTTAEPTTVEPTTVEPTTVEPTTAKPTEKSTKKPTEPTTKKAVSSSSASKNSNNNFQTYDNKEQQNTTEYVLNTNTMKVHKASCRHVKKISPENYATISSLQDAYSKGYEACKTCNP
ncbi:MAG: hypothetical protein J1E85_01600 [Ruminococcus sp.]|nr:hypothetical protein [Ruminococcus sp.]